MKTVTVIVTGVAVSAPIPVDQYISPCNIGLAFIRGAGCTATVQHTFDDVFSPTFNPGTATWFNHPTMAAMVANTDGNYAAPPKAIRLNQTVGAAASTFIVNQAGASG